VTTTDRADERRVQLAKERYRALRTDFAVSSESTASERAAAKGGLER